VSQRGVDHTKRFAELAAAIGRLRARTLILDGEVCAFDEALGAICICSWTRRPTRS
jgi:ATP-dependent DNA ligase